MNGLETATERFQRARSALVHRSPFWGTLALGLELIESDRFPTAATDGRRLWFNPEYVAKLTDEKLIGLAAHEVNHPALCHHTRRGGRDRELWNLAADYFIDPGLVAAGFDVPDATIDPRFNGLSTEQIYRVLESERRQKEQSQPKAGTQGQQSGQGGAGKPDKSGQQSGGAAPGQNNGQGQPQPGAGGNGPANPGNGTSGAPGQSQGQPGGPSEPASCGNGGKGEVIDAAPGHSPGELAAQESEWQARVRQAVSVARKAAGAGKLPGDIGRTIAELNQPRLDWREVMRRFIDDSSFKVASWSRPSRRFAWSGLILPGNVSDRARHIVNVIDISGSIGDDELKKNASEVQAILDDGATDRVTVVYTDTEVRRVVEFEPGDVVKLESDGGGGTDFRAVFSWIDDSTPDASAIVFMTDCDVRQWGTEPACPVLWIVTGDPRRAAILASKAPFGESILLGD